MTDRPTPAQLTDAQVAENVRAQAADWRDAAHVFEGLAGLPEGMAGAARQYASALDAQAATWHDDSHDETDQSWGDDPLEDADLPTDHDDPKGTTP